MLSLSKNEFNVIGFLIRNFSKRFTIRNITALLKTSSAGMHAALKKLEKNGIVKAERLGTGLFYEINLGNKAAHYLAAVSLLEHFGIKKINSKEIEKESKAALFDGKRLLVVTSNPDTVKDICYKEIRDIKIICKSEEELFRDNEDLDILEKGNALFGEGLILKIIRGNR